jgi:hypothetical protein
MPDGLWRRLTGGPNNGIGVSIGSAARCEADEFVINLACGLTLTRLLEHLQTDHVVLFQVIKAGNMEGVRAAVRKHIESTPARLEGRAPTGLGRGGRTGLTGRRLAGKTHN